MQAGKDGGMTMRRPAAKPNEFYKVSLCKHFQNGECPFGEGCHFAHGEAELRRYPKPGMQSGTDGGELSENMFGQGGDGTTVDYYQGGQSGGGRPSPILMPENAAFFIMRAATYRDCAVSTVRGEWYVQERHAEMINKAMSQGMQVMTFFTVGDSLHIQGAALVTSKAEMIGGATKRKRQPKSNAVSADKDGPFSYRFKCVWYRTCELPVSTALDAAPDLLLPTPATRYCQDMTSKTGEAVMKAVWNSPLCTLYESFSDDGDESRKPPTPENVLKDFRCPSPGEVPWPTMPSPGFIFGCNSQTMDECLGRGLFGLPAHMKAAAAGIRPGSSIFLYNVSEKLFFGIFESLTSARMNIDPRAFSKNPNATTSPFPVQIRVRISLECPPIHDDDPVLNDILRARVGGRIGPMTFAQSEALASLIAGQCGALSYMEEYKRGVESGAMNLSAPPIALPPRKIGS